MRVADGLPVPIVARSSVDSISPVVTSVNFTRLAVLITAVTTVMVRSVKEIR